MTLTDQYGHAVSGASPESLACFEQASHELRCFIADPVATVDRALDASPDMTMAHVLKAWLHLLGTEPEGIPVARACHEAAANLPATERERAHLEAIRLLVDGRWHAAGRVLEDLSIAWPRDPLALQAGHQIDFFTGNSRMLRDRIARALPAWSGTMPGYHAVLGMHAFGLEETADYEQAERQGRRCVELEPRDGWGWHAVAHVIEMRNRPRDGIAWLQPNSASWAPESFLAVHNWWHLALYHLELGDIDEVLRLFDGPIFGARSTVVVDMIDASAMLWRLQMRGVDVGDRWQAVADNWAPIAGAGNYAFNDMHAMMAFVSTGQLAPQQQVLDAQEAALAGDADNAAFTREAGRPATLAIRAFGEGDYAQAIRLLRSIRSIAHRFGGSHAQRDVIDLTLIEAALRSDDPALARALVNERVALRPTSPLSRLFAARAASVAAASGGASSAGSAARAARLLAEPL
ncbi:tetratricopeptide repeat protein [Burkholderiaceae bacterium FT117]|uniref:tetratricopeptide repeat protein n=1 Tax=Zeimonas sediminis TaxID=2944268 RepID=UPI002342C095|nr:tetratricopeptide repeat protein [Zeimonas sediminis]MCM5569287.1 tetratricopeptide repeat protein [Zeimonas sediminis]